MKKLISETIDTKNLGLIESTDLSKLYKYNSSIIKIPKQTGVDKKKDEATLIASIYESQLITMLRVLSKDEHQFYP
jgi:hypothetical protein